PATTAANAISAARAYPDWDAPRSDAIVGHRRRDPRNHLVEHVAQRGGRLEPEDPLRLLGRRYPLLHVVLERRVGDVPERHVKSLELAPDRLRELEHARRRIRREVEVVVERVGVLDRNR